VSRIETPLIQTFPEIDDEVAAARALGRLSQLLLGTAAGDLSDVTGHHVTLDH
jgi:hypothetical protein